MVIIIPRRRRGTWKGVAVANCCGEGICRMWGGLVHHIIKIPAALCLPLIILRYVSRCCEVLQSWRLSGVCHQQYFKMTDFVAESPIFCSLQFFRLLVISSVRGRIECCGKICLWEHTQTNCPLCVTFNNAYTYAHMWTETKFVRECTLKINSSLRVCVQSCAHMWTETNFVRECTLKQTVLCTCASNGVHNPLFTYVRPMLCTVFVACASNVVHCVCCVWTDCDCNILQHTCSTLQHATAHCNILQRTAIYCNTLQYTAAHCNTLQCTATHCSALQHTAAYCSTL